jgi:hypothetical protein
MWEEAERASRNGLVLLVFRSAEQEAFDVLQGAVCQLEGTGEARGIEAVCGTPHEVRCRQSIVTVGNWLWTSAVSSSQVDRREG